MGEQSKKIGYLIVVGGKILLKETVKGLKVPLSRVTNKKKLTRRDVNINPYGEFSFVKKLQTKSQKNVLVENYLLMGPINMVPNHVFSKKGLKWVKIDEFLYKKVDKSVINALLRYFKQSKVLIVSGTPGTGKTTFSKELSLLIQGKNIELSRYVKTRGLGNWIAKDRTLDVDIKKLNKLLIEDIKSFKSTKINGKCLIIDGHMSHYLPPKYADICVILSYSDLKGLKARLIERGYKSAKIRDNMDSEIFQVCRVEAIEAGHNITDLDASKKNLVKKLLNDFGILFYNAL